MEKFFINGSTLEIEMADSFFSRLRGLMGRRHLDKGTGLLLVPCNSIHMLFMRFAIDVIYIDKEFCIKKIARSVPTWIGMSFCFGAWGALEMASGEADRLKLAVGQKFQRENPAH